MSLAATGASSHLHVESREAFPRKKGTARLFVPIGILVVTVIAVETRSMPALDYAMI